MARVANTSLISASRAETLYEVILGSSKINRKLLPHEEPMVALSSAGKSSADGVTSGDAEYLPALMHLSTVNHDQLPELLQCGREILMRHLHIFPTEFERAEALAMYDMTAQNVQNAPKLMEACLRLAHCCQNTVGDRRQTTEYPFGITMLIGVLAFASGANYTTGIQSFWEQHFGALSALLPGLPPPPSQSTLHKVLSLDYQDLANDEGFQPFFRDFCRLIRQDLLLSTRCEAGFALPEGTGDFKAAITIGLDGKTENGTYRAGSCSRNTKAVDCVQLFDCTNLRTLAYRLVQLKNHEKDVVAELLEESGITGAVFSCDALNSTAQVMETVHQSGNHFIVSIKSNGGNKQLYTCAKELALPCLNAPESVAELGGFYYKTSPKLAHGRLSENEFVLLPALALPEDVRRKYPHVKSFALRKHCCQKVIFTEPSEADKPSFTSKLKRVRPTIVRRVYALDMDCTFDTLLQLMCTVNDYWMIEMNHYFRDCYLQEDKIVARELSFIDTIVAMKMIASTLVQFTRGNLVTNPTKRNRPATFAYSMARLGGNMSFAAFALSQLLESDERFDLDEQAYNCLIENERQREGMQKAMESWFTSR